MPDAATRGQMHVRLSRFLKAQPLVLSIHPKVIDEALEMAWGNGWRDEEWLATYALEGIAHESVKEPAAVFVTRLREAAAMPCPTDPGSPSLPTIAEVLSEGYCGGCGQPERLDHLHGCQRARSTRRASA